ncbi:hypothetical protein E2C01_052338 [Portunus trituberculatus]|uniref:Uncharacterized protein n=1 Tax=Portunus trituberculatus TaxID=210409 RepID=A0A5B7GLA5_PORTR|nr:hypothetical protein [Portunus trituberculatus]
MVSSVGAASDDQFSVITVKSENEASTLPGYKDDSSPLFDLEEIEDHKAPLDKDLLTSENQDHSTPLDEEPENSENSHVSSNLLDCIPDIDLDVDDQETVCFDNEHLHATSSTKEDRQENQKSPLNHDNSSVSEKADLKNSETAADALEDPEGDELIASLSEEAIDQFAIPLLEKIIKWRKNCEEAQANVPANENNPSTGLKKKKNIVIQPGCIHFHYHEANPVQSHSKESKAPDGEKKMASKQENSAAWQRLMGHKQKRSLVPLPPVSQNSSSEVRQKC